MTGPPPAPPTVAASSARSVPISGCLQTMMGHSTSVTVTVSPSPGIPCRQTPVWLPSSVASRAANLVPRQASGNAAVTVTGRDELESRGQLNVGHPAFEFAIRVRRSSVQNTRSSNSPLFAPSRNDINSVGV